MEPDKAFWIVWTLASLYALAWTALIVALVVLVLKFIF